MGVADYCTTKVETLGPGATAAEAARLMRDRGIGSVVVQMAEGPGIVTDRDLVMRALAARRDPRQLRLGDIVSTPVATVPATASLAEAALLMRECAVRRLPVMDVGGELVGIVTYDDLVELLGRELSEIAAMSGGGSGEESPAMGGQ